MSRTPRPRPARTPRQAMAPSLWRQPAMVLIAGYTLAGFTGYFVTMSSLPAWLAAGGTSGGLAGQVTTVLLAATVATQVLVPQMVRLAGLGPVLAAGMVALGVPSLLLLIDGGLLWVMGISAVRGIGFGILTVLGSTVTARIVPPERRGEAIGIYGLSIAVPNLLAVPGGVALVTAGHFAPVAIIGAAPLVGLLTVPALARLVGGDEAPAGGGAGRNPTTGGRGAGAGEPGPAVTTDDDVRVRSARAAADARAARRAARLASIGPATVLMVVTLAGGGFLTYLPIARPEGALATVALLVWGITGALSRWVVGRMADRSGLRVLLPASSLIAVAGVAVVVAGLLMGAGAAGAAVTVVGAAVLGAGFGASQNLTLVSAFARARQQEIATVSAVWNVGFDTGTALGAALVGALTTVVGVPSALAVTGLMILASLPLAISGSRPPGPEPGAGTSPG